MELDLQCLREARLENVERLARALSIPLPVQLRHDRRAYARRLYSLVLRRIEADEAEDAVRRLRAPAQA